MFGGAGLYRAQRMFGLIADDTLYFKVGPGNRGNYEAAGMRPFAYAAKGRTKTINSYWEVPVAVVEEPERLAGWALAAWVAGIAEPRRRSGAESRKIRMKAKKR